MIVRWQRPRKNVCRCYNRVKWYIVLSWKSAEFVRMKKMITGLFWRDNASRDDCISFFLFFETQVWETRTLLLKSARPGKFSFTKSARNTWWTWRDNCQKFRGRLISLIDRLTNLNEHQSNVNSASRKSISTLVLLKSRGHDGIFHSGFTSSCNSFSSCENGVVLPNLTTTLKQKQLYFFFWNDVKCLVKWRRER